MSEKADALRTYGRHGTFCAHSTGGLCDCGFSSALEKYIEDEIKADPEEMYALAQEKGLPFVLDHMGYDGLGNIANELVARRGLLEAVDNVLQWIKDEHPKVLREIPTDLWRAMVIGTLETKYVTSRKGK